MGYVFSKKNQEEFYADEAPEEFTDYENLPDDDTD